MRSNSWNESVPVSPRRSVTLDPWYAVLRGFAEGLRRARQRRDLAALSDHHLRDIGLSRTEVEREFMKPFWRD